MVERVHSHLTNWWWYDPARLAAGEGVGKRKRKKIKIKAKMVFLVDEVIVISWEGMASCERRNWTTCLALDCIEVCICQTGIIMLAEDRGHEGGSVGRGEQG